MRAHSSMPLIAPMCTSVMSRSGEITSSRPMAFSADSAVTTLWPIAVRSSPRTWRIAGSSSTTMMVATSAGGRLTAAVSMSGRIQPHRLEDQRRGEGEVPDVHPLVDGVELPHPAREVRHLEAARGEHVGVRRPARRPRRARPPHRARRSLDEGDDPGRLRDVQALVLARDLDLEAGAVLAVTDLDQ